MFIYSKSSPLCFFVLCIGYAVESLPVSKLHDLCNRFPDIALCTTGHKAEAAASSPTPAPTSRPQLSQYCQQDRPKYISYCVNILQNQLQGDVFCDNYRGQCDTSSMFAPAPAQGVHRTSAHKVKSGSAVQYEAARMRDFQPKNTNWLFPAAVQEEPIAMSAKDLIRTPLSFLGGPDANVAGTSDALPYADAPLSLGYYPGVQVGGYYKKYAGLNVNPMRGVGGGTSISAAGLPINRSGKVYFGGLIPSSVGRLFDNF